MTVTISPDLEGTVREKAAAEGMSVDAYVDHLIRQNESDPELEEIRAAIDEADSEFERGEGQPIEEFFAQFRAEHGLPSRNQ